LASRSSPDLRAPTWLSEWNEVDRTVRERLREGSQATLVQREIRRSGSSLHDPFANFFQRCNAASFAQRTGLRPFLHRRDGPRESASTLITVWRWVVGGASIRKWVEQTHDIVHWAKRFSHIAAKNRLLIRTSSKTRWHMNCRYRLCLALSDERSSPWPALAWPWEASNLRESKTWQLTSMSRLSIPTAPMAS
jgi:hypothetical protein